MRLIERLRKNEKREKSDLVAGDVYSEFSQFAKYAQGETFESAWASFCAARSTAVPWNPAQRMPAALGPAEFGYKNRAPNAAVDRGPHGAG